MRVAIARNTVLEEQLAHDRDLSVAELNRVRAEVVATALAAAPRRRRGRLRAELEAIFAEADFPFRHERRVPSLIVRGAAGEHALDPSFRADEQWPVERKLALLEEGYRLADEAFSTPPAELGPSLEKVGRGPGRRSDPMPM